ncbi:MAG: hypothetical protein ACM3MB_02480 [Acidobacteriota bacterium]
MTDGGSLSCLPIQGSDERRRTFLLWLASVDVPREFSQSPHGRMAAPTGIWEHVVVAISVVIVLFCIYLCVRYFLLPREKEEGHIKKRILDDEVPGDLGGDT